jgi:hypothetical protein
LALADTAKIKSNGAPLRQHKRTRQGLYNFVVHRAPKQWMWVGNHRDAFAFFALCELRLVNQHFQDASLALQGLLKRSRVHE